MLSMKKAERTRGPAALRRCPDGSFSFAGREKDEYQRGRRVEEKGFIEHSLYPPSCIFFHPTFKMNMRIRRNR